MSTTSQFDWAGVIFWLVFAALFFGAAYWVWPEGAMDVSLSKLTLGQLLRAGGAGLLGLLGLGAIGGAIKDANDPFT